MEICKKCGGTGKPYRPLGCTSWVVQCEGCEMETSRYDTLREAWEEWNVYMAPEPGDRIKQPKHYTQYKAMEPFTFLMVNNIPFAEGCVVKYTLRWREKNGIEDLKKARRILEMMIEMEENRHLYTPEKSCL